MAKYFRFSVAVLLVLILVSWGYDGHHAVGFIAQRHLSEKAAAAVKDLLGNDDMADVSTYADDIKNVGQFKSTAALHFFDLPAGLTFEEFQQQIKNTTTPNVYQGIGSAIRDLEDRNKSRTQRAFALKMLIHLVGDAHQPMHVGHTEDRGGNSIAVKFFSSSTDLHSLWDEGILQHQNLKYKDFAAKFDDATPEQIKRWQSDNVITWLWESYQITTILYQEAAADPNFGEDYYKTHLPIVKNRIEKAGIRLAGVLNDIYK